MCIDQNVLSEYLDRLLGREFIFGVIFPTTEEAFSKRYKEICDLCSQNGFPISCFQLEYIEIMTNPNYHYFKDAPLTTHDGRLLCDLSGSMTCSVCHGSGYYTLEVERAKHCFQCKGKGEIVEKFGAKKGQTVSCPGCKGVSTYVSTNKSKFYTDCWMCSTKEFLKIQDVSLCRNIQQNMNEC